MEAPGLVNGYYNVWIEGSLATSNPDLVSLFGLDQYDDGSAKYMGVQLRNNSNKPIPIQTVRSKIADLAGPEVPVQLGTAATFTWETMGYGEQFCYVDGQKVANTADLVSRGADTDEQWRPDQWCPGQLHGSTTGSCLPDCCTARCTAEHRPALLTHCHPLPTRLASGALRVAAQPQGCGQCQPHARGGARRRVRRGGRQRRVLWCLGLAAQHEVPAPSAATAGARARGLWPRVRAADAPAADAQPHNQRRGGRGGQQQLAGRRRRAARGAACALSGMREHLRERMNEAVGAGGRQAAQRCGAAAGRRTCMCARLLHACCSRARPQLQAWRCADSCSPLACNSCSAWAAAAAAGNPRPRRRRQPPRSGLACCEATGRQWGAVDSFTVGSRRAGSCSSGLSHNLLPHSSRC